MNTSNPFDLSSFEPEAILASLPGDHPKMTAALAVGRQASNSGQLDVNELVKIANEIYSQGLPTDPAFPKQGELPTSTVFPDPLLAHGETYTSGASSQAVSSKGLESGHVRSIPDIESILVNHVPNSDRINAPGAQSIIQQLQRSNPVSAPEIPNQRELNDILAKLQNGHSFDEVNSLSGKNKTNPYYFLDGLPSHTDFQLDSASHPPFDAYLVRKDFPILGELVNGRPLIWFDNAATTQKPLAVIDRISYFYKHENSNIHRAAHELAARATDAYEDARETVRRFINASSVDNIVFVRGTTEAINLVAKSWGKKHLGENDEILITHLEHHANIVPWQQLCLETGAKLKVAPVDESGQVILSEYQRLLTSRTKLVSFTQVSNALGTVTPAQEMIEMAHRAGAKVLLDGAQSVSHMRTDVASLGCDFFVFSGHKVFGPTGIGALFGTDEVLNDMPVWQGGGNMIQDVTFEKTIYHEPPAKFEAGTGNIADAVGLGAALEYVERVGIENIARYEHELLEYATASLCRVPGLRLIGTAKEKASVSSFNLEGFTSEEVGAALNSEGIAVRSGHHCAQPILRRFGVETTVRPSLAFYNTFDEIDYLLNALLRLTSGKGIKGL